MLGENQSIVPNFTLFPSPNPNPNSSPFVNLQTPDSAAYNHAGVVMSETTNVSQVMHLADYFGVMTRPVTKITQSVYCEVCKIMCNTQDMFEKHKQGKKHLKKLQKISNLSTVPELSIENAPTLGDLENKKLSLLKNGASIDTLISCDLCNITCNNQDVFQTHLAGKKHCAKAEIEAVKANGVLNSISGSQNKPENINRCEICKISCTSGEHLNLHLAGKKHQKKIKKTEQIPITQLVTSPSKPVEIAHTTEVKTVIPLEGKRVLCELCGIICTSYEVLKTHITGKKHQKNLEKSEKLAVTKPVIEPTPEATPLVTGPQKQVPSKEEVIVVKFPESKKKTEREGDHEEDVETKKQKILDESETVDATRTCTVQP